MRYFRRHLYVQKKEKVVKRRPNRQWSSPSFVCPEETKGRQTSTKSSMVFTFIFKEK